MSNPDPRSLNKVSGMWAPHPIFELVEGEDANNPFSVPREVLKERFQIMVLSIGGMGLMQKQGIKDPVTARDFFLNGWEESTKTYNRVVEAMEAEENTGCSMIIDMAYKGQLTNYQMNETDDEKDLIARYAELREYYSKYKEKQCSKTMQ